MTLPSPISPSFASFPCRAEASGVGGCSNSGAVSGAVAVVPFSVPDPDLADFAKLPEECRADVRRKLHALQLIDSAPSVLPACKAQAALMQGARGWSATRLRSLYYEYKKTGDWRCVMDRARAGAEFVDRENVSLPGEFVEFWRGLCERYQRKTRPARRELLHIWRTHHSLPRGNQAPRTHKAIPGYPDWPAAGEHGYPIGWSEANLYRCAPTKFELTAARIGRMAAAAVRPQVFTTRHGLRVGQFYFFDDQEYDVNTSHPANPRVMRPLGLNSLDLLSACLFAYAFKPTLWDADAEKKKKLIERDMLWFVVHVLTQFGYRDDESGTRLVVEHGTAAIREDFEQRIFDSTHGKVRVDRGGIGGTPAFDGLFEGQARGNFRFKAALESIFNLVRNEMAMLPGNVGLDRHHSPEELHGRTRYANSLIRAALTLPPERAALLRLPFLTWEQFTQVSTEMYQRINYRCDHDLEGWAKCGFVTSEWRLNDQQPWLTQDQFLALPSTEQAVARQLLETRPSLTRARKLSPQEVFNRDASQLIKVQSFLLPALLGLEFGVERQLKHSRFFEFEDQDIDSDTLRYIATPQTPLRPGEKYLTFLNPFKPAELVVCDAQGRFLALCPRWVSPCRSDVEAIHRQMGEVKKLEAQLLAPVARRGAEVAREKLEMHRHNAAVLAGRPASPNPRLKHFEGSTEDLLDPVVGTTSTSSPSTPSETPEETTEGLL